MQKVVKNAEEPSQTLFDDDFIEDSDYEPGSEDESEPEDNVEAYLEHMNIDPEFLKYEKLL